jgi:hypothetical protein
MAANGRKWPVHCPGGVLGDAPAWRCARPPAQAYHGVGYGSGSLTGFEQAAQLGPQFLWPGPVLDDGRDGHLLILLCQRMIIRVAV